MLWLCAVSSFTMISLLPPVNFVKSGAQPGVHCTLGNIVLVWTHLQGLECTLPTPVLLKHSELIDDKCAHSVTLMTELGDELVRGEVSLFPLPSTLTKMSEHQLLPDSVSL